jgi:hypothetical protein
MAREGQAGSARSRSRRKSFREHTLPSRAYIGLSARRARRSSAASVHPSIARTCLRWLVSAAGRGLGALDDVAGDPRQWGSMGIRLSVGVIVYLVVTASAARARRPGTGQGRGRLASAMRRRRRRSSPSRPATRVFLGAQVQGGVRRVNQQANHALGPRRRSASTWCRCLNLSWRSRLQACGRAPTSERSRYGASPFEAGIYEEGHLRTRQLAPRSRSASSRSTASQPGGRVPPTFPPHLLTIGRRSTWSRVRGSK